MDVGGRETVGNYIYDLATDENTRTKLKDDAYDLAVGAGTALAGAPSDIASIVLQAYESGYNEGGDFSMTGNADWEDVVGQLPLGSEHLSEGLGADTGGLPWLMGQLVDPFSPTSAKAAIKVMAAGAEHAPDLFAAAMTGLKSVGGKKLKPHQVSPNSKEWSELGIDEIDRAAFGFAEGDIKSLPADEIQLKWVEDMENVEHQIAISGKSREEWAQSVDRSTPIDVIYEDGAFKIDDGHHRYTAAKILGEDVPVSLTIKDKPHVALVDRALANGEEVNPELLDAAEELRRNGEKIAPE